ncbi:MAG: class I SAM-dependent methyltransferase [Verrucomicrobiota bacterium]|nr:class I SAM-dependent methyltransferase [Verrucomicrobiota bacterium]
MSFNLVAPFYRTLETIVFGNALQRARTALLPQLAHSRRALLAGEGNGRCLAELRRIHPTLEIDCVDASAEMLRLARAVIPSAADGSRNTVILSEVEGSRRESLKVTSPGSLDFARDDVRFIHADVREFQTETTYDALVTNFLLDCFDEHELARVIANLADAAEPRARWLISEFTLPRAGFARLFARVLIAIMYAFFRVTTRISAKHLIDYRPLLAAHGFALIEQQRFFFGMVTAECWERTR